MYTQWFCQADAFHKQWSTPPSGSPKHVKQKFVITRRQDSDKGFERLGRYVQVLYLVNIICVDNRAYGQGVGTQERERERGSQNGSVKVWNWK